MEDEAIVEMYLSRDDSAIHYTKEKYGPRLRGIALNLLQSPPDAEECENDTYLEAWNRIPPHEPKDYLFAFLARITRHLSLDRCRGCRRQKRSAVLVELTSELEQCLPAGDDVQLQLEGAELAAYLSGFLRSLPQRQRRVFLLRYWYLEPVSAIARRNHMSESGVKSMLFRIRRSLREALEKEGLC